MTRVGISNLMQDIKTATMAKFNENVDNLFDFMFATYTKILDEGESYPHFLKYLFKALLTAKNDIFRTTIQCEKDDWDNGKEITEAHISEVAKTNIKRWWQIRSGQKSTQKMHKSLLSQCW